MMRFLAVVLWGISVVAAAQRDAPPVQIVSGDGVTPVPFAVLLNRSTGKAVTANAEGKTAFPTRGSRDTLIVRSTGYLDLVILPSDAIPRKLRMVEDLVSLQVAEVAVRATSETTTADRLTASAGLAMARMSPVKNLEVPTNSAELLWSTGSVLVQQSQQGGGSPVIRGFEANRILLVVDGVRMNNAIYRSGHLQNALTVDPAILSRTEVVLGPNSVAYGSDALGGVIHYTTREPQLGRNGVFSRGSYAYRSPNNSHAVHADVEVGMGPVASLTSVTATEFGDLRMGTRRTHGDAEWGLVREVVAQVDGRDTVLTNDDPTLQLRSGYRQLDLLQKLAITLPDGSIVLNLQYSTTTDIPRFDLFDDRSGGTLKWAEWEYGPQERLLASARYRGYIRPLRAAAGITASYQRVGEDRINRRFQQSTRYHQEETVDILDLTASLTRTFRNGIVGGLGFNGAWNGVTSVAWSEDIHTGVRDDAEETRYPNGGSDFSQWGAFVTLRSRPGRFTYSAGARYSFADLHCRYAASRTVELPFDRIESRKGAVTGSASADWAVAKSWSLQTVVSSGFRHPNVDDVGKVFEKGGWVTVPNDSLRPEFVYSAEQGVRWDLGGRHVLALGVSGFATLWDDAIVPVAATVGGSDTLLYNGDYARVQTNVNAGQAVLTGARAELQAQLTKQLGLEAAVNVTTGELRDSGAPIAHIPPLFGRAAASYSLRGITLQCYTLFNGAKSIDLYSADGEDNPDEALPQGTPAWWTLNFESSWQLHRTAQVRLGVRNLLDQHYQVFSSGIAAPGRGIYTSLHLQF